MRVQRYEKYKASGIDLLGEIPEGWEVKRLKEVSNIFTGTTPSSSNPDYFFDEINWFTPSDFSQIPLKDSKRKISKLAIKDNQAKLFRKNSVLLVSIGATLGKVSYSENIFSCNQQINPLTPKKIIDYKYYFYYLYCSNLLIKSFSLETTLAILNQDRSGLIPIILPPLQTQTAIAKYLDQHTALIDKRIELLKAKKQSYLKLKQTLINEVITKGLDKTVEMKESGIEWIGQMPKHWEVSRLKEISNNIYAGGTPSTIIEEYWNKEDYIWLPSGELQNNIIYQHSENKFISEKGLKNSSTKLIEKDTALIALTGATCANIGYLTFQTCANQSVVAITTSKKFYSKFLFYYLLIKRSYIKIFQTGGAQAGINTEDVKNLWVELPPKSEQIAIANYLDEKTSKIDQIIKKIDDYILALQEFRKTLINDAVTGKVKIL